MARLPNCPTEDDVYHIYSVRFAHLERRVHQNFMIADGHDGPMPLDYNFWIVLNQIRTVLVDTGFGPRAAAARGRILLVDPIESLSTLGIDVASIEDVIITHLHYDHAGNIDRLPRARFHVQDSEVFTATGRCMCEDFIRFAYDVEDVVALVRHNFAQRVRFHDGDDVCLPGMSLHHLPGHTAGIQAVKVKTPRGDVLLASDVSHYYANFMKRSPFSLIVDVSASLSSYSRLFELVPGLDHIVPGHDPLIREIYPTLEIDGIMLAELHKAPKSLSI